MRWAMVQRALGVAVLVCLCSGMAQGHAQECGDNPMKQVLLVAKRAGRSLTHVLTLLRDIDGGAYDTLSQKFRLYAACVGLVDTGYFRKRSGATLPMLGSSPGTRLAYTGHRIRVRDIEIAHNELPYSQLEAYSPQPPPPPQEKPSSPPSAARRPQWRGESPTSRRSKIQLWLSRTQANLTSGLRESLRRDRQPARDSQPARESQPARDHQPATDRQPARSSFR